MNLTIAMKVRVRNLRRLTVGVVLLGIIARWMKPERIVALGNRLLKILRVETSLGSGPWMRIEHGLQFTVEGGTATPSAET